MLYAFNPQEPENWFRYACLFTNRAGICIVKPTEIFLYFLFPIKFPLEWYYWQMQPTKVEVEKSIEKKSFFTRARKLALIHMPLYKPCWYMQG